MQLLEHQPETRSYSTDEGHFIEGFLIGTKANEAKWRISKKTAHDLVQKFVGKDFAIIPELIQKPLSQGGGGHYFGLDTKPDLLNGYATHSHGKYTKIKGPYSYNDGTDDFFYLSQIKLRDSKAASALLAEGQKTWIPFAVSPHIWPLSGPDDNIEDWEPIGGALVIKGAYGPQAVISKMCKGTSAQCEKSLGAALQEVNDTIVTLTKETEDGNTAQIISSLVSKSASSPHTMPENIPEVTAAPKVTETIQSKSVTLDPQNTIMNSAKIVTPEQFETLSTEKAALEKQVTQLVNEAKMNTLNNMFVKVKDEKQKKELLDEYSKLDKDKVDLINAAITKLYPILKASEEPVIEVAEEDDKKKKGKSASLPAERELPKEETESKTASVPVNKTKEIVSFLKSYGGL